MKIYIAGKITNDKNYKEKFARAEKTIKERLPDVSVLNPAALPEKMREWFNADETAHTRKEIRKFI